MAVIRDIAKYFPSGAQQQRPQRIDRTRGKITEGQQAQLELQREQMRSQEKARQEALMVQGIFQALGFVERGVTAGLQMSKDPAQIRTEEIRGERLGESLEEMRAKLAAARADETPTTAPTPPTEEWVSRYGKPPTTPGGTLGTPLGRTPESFRVREQAMARMQDARAMGARQEGLRDVPPAPTAEDLRGGRGQMLTKGYDAEDLRLQIGEAQKRLALPPDAITPDERAEAAKFMGQWKAVLADIERRGEGAAPRSFAQQPAQGQMSTVPQQSLASPADLAAPAPPATPPAPEATQALNMTSGDWADLEQNYKPFLESLKNEKAMAKFLNDLERQGISRTEAQSGLEGLGRLIAEKGNLVQGGRLNIQEGPSSGFWARSAQAAGKSTVPWKRGYAAAKEFREGGAEALALYDKIQQVREAAPESVERVADAVLSEPSVLAGAIEEAQKIAPGQFDFEAAVTAQQAGDYKTVKRLVMPVLTAPRGTYKGKVKGLEAARERFGAPPVEGVPSEEFRYPEPNTYSWKKLQDAWAALDEANDPRADKLLEDRVILGVMDLESIPGIEQGATPQQVLGRARAAVTSGKAERGESGFDRATRLYKLATAGEQAALEERKVKIGEHEATSKRMRVGKLRSRRDWAASAAASRASGDVESVYESDWFQIVKERDGESVAKKYAKWQVARGSSVAKTSAGRKRAEAIIAEDEGADEAARTVEATRLRTADTQSAALVKKDNTIIKREAAVTKLEGKHGVASGQLLTEHAWIEDELVAARGRGVRAGEIVAFEEALEDKARAKVAGINTQLKKARARVKLAEKDKSKYMKRHGLEE